MPSQITPKTEYNVTVLQALRKALDTGLAPVMIGLTATEADYIRSLTATELIGLAASQAIAVAVPTNFLRFGSDRSPSNRFRQVVGHRPAAPNLKNDTIDGSAPPDLDFLSVALETVQASLNRQQFPSQGL